MDPRRPKPLDATYNTQNRVGTAEQAGRSVPFAHVRSQILSNDGGLIVWLYEQIGRKETCGRLFHHHHRIPMMHMGSFPEAKPVSSKIEHVAVLHALESNRIVPLLKIDPGSRRAAGQHGLWCLRREAHHPAAFVGFEVRNNDIAEPGGIEHLGDRCTDVIVHRKGASVNERRFVIVDQELIEANPLLRSIGRDAIYTAGHMIYARHRDRPLSAEGAPMLATAATARKLIWVGCGCPSHSRLMRSASVTASLPRRPLPRSTSVPPFDRPALSALCGDRNSRGNRTALDPLLMGWTAPRTASSVPRWSLSQTHLKGSRPWASLSSIPRLSRASGLIWPRGSSAFTRSTRRASSSLPAQSIAERF